MDFNADFLQLTIEKIAGAKNQSDIYWEETERTSLRLDDGKIEIASIGQEKGVGIRKIGNGHVSFSYVTNPTAQTLEGAAESLIVAGEGGSGPVPTKKGQRHFFHHPREIDPRERTPREKTDVLTRSDQAARNRDPRIKQVTAILNDTVKHVYYMDSDGRLIEETRSYVRFIVQAVAIDKDRAQIGMEAPGVMGGLEFLEDISVEELAVKAADTAIAMLAAVPAPAGPMPVVLASGFGGVLFHEACGHGLEADHMHKGSSFKGLLGKQVAAPQVTLIDDPTIPGLWGSYAFDDEGEKSRKKILIEKGILTELYVDRFWGQKLGLQSNASARRESYAHPPLPRMGNTFLQAGDLSPEDVIKQTEKGLYAQKLGGGEVNPETGDFVFSVSEGYLIEKGKITKPVRGAMLIGNGLKVLRDIDLVANDISYDPGVCGKDGQGVPVTSGQPTTRVKTLTVGGTDIG